MSGLFKVQVTYITRDGGGARATAVLSAADERAAEESAIQAVKSCSQSGVREIRGTVVTRNSLNVEFLGRQPA